MNPKNKPTQKMQAWIQARKRHHLCHTQVHIAPRTGDEPGEVGQDTTRTLPRFRKAHPTPAPGSRVISSCIAASNFGRSPNEKH